MLLVEKIRLNTFFSSSSIFFFLVKCQDFIFQYRYFKKFKHCSLSVFVIVTCLQYWSNVVLPYSGCTEIKPMITDVWKRLENSYQSILTILCSRDMTLKLFYVNFVNFCFAEYLLKFFSLFVVCLTSDSLSGLRCCAVIRWSPVQIPCQ